MDLNLDILGCECKINTSNSDSNSNIYLIYKIKVLSLASREVITTNK